MKKKYITPRAINLNLYTESLMIGNSMEVYEETTSTAWTQEQKPTTNMWDNWSE